MFEDVRIAVGGGANSKRLGFTLAEVLITLGIIGVVAAITMPVLLSNVQDRVKEKRVENIKQKLSKVTDKMAVQSGLTGYGDTMSFVREMNKHMKIAKICDNSHISDCWPTREVDLNKDGKMWEMSKTKNAKTLLIPKNIQDNWADTVGVVTADGTAMILSYDKTCDFDVDKTGLIYDKGSAMSNSMGCLSGVFDWNGGKKPNKLGQDVITIGKATGLGTACAFEIGNICFTAPFTPSPLSQAECNEKKDILGIEYCYSDNDYWGGAVKECGGISKMPTMAQLGQLATELYGVAVGVDDDKYDLTLNESKASSMGFVGSDFSVWSGEEVNYYYSKYRFFNPWSTGYGRPNMSMGRQYQSSIQAVCIGD